MLGMWSATILSGSWNKVATMFAGTGVIFAAVYLLWMVQRVFFGRLSNEKNKGLTDLSLREIALMVPLLFLMVFMGVYPRPILERSRESVVAIQQIVNGETRGGEIEKVSTKPKDENSKSDH